MYKIDDSYIHREDPQLFDDSHNSDEFQYEVYQLAHTIAKIIDKNPVLDVGCGSGYKLKTIFSDFDTLGIELEDQYSRLVLEYPNDNWAVKEDTPPSGKFGVVVFADVIEHAIDPDELMEYIKKVDFEYLIISTPYRDNARLSQTGPPNNPAHAREWTVSEFKEYASQYFTIVNHFIINKVQATQCVICKK